MSGESHIPDHDLIALADGEISRHRKHEVQEHLTHCRACSSRLSEIRNTMADFVQAYQDSLDTRFPAPLASRAMLRARLSQLADEHPRTVWQRVSESLLIRRLAYMSCIFILAAAGLIFWQSSKPSFASSPNPKLTPGVALPLTQADICSTVPVKRSHSELAAIGKEIFEEYGIPKAQQGRYELDYLIDPELGGTDDSQNLWPQPYSADWNAHVKDALEVHLRELVCTGKISLADAQRDISDDWIAAYKKYFRANRPLPEHLAFQKDQPWDN